MAASSHGAQLFGGITAAGALAALREMLNALGVVKHEVYRTHDLRRGHALDLQCSGAPLCASYGEPALACVVTAVW